jgi:hypothetical protein
MNRIFCYTVLCLIVVTKVSGQNQRVDHVVDRNSGGFMEFHAKPEATPESIYLDDAWTKGSVSLRSGQEIADLSIRYDLKNNLLEIQTPTGIKVVGLMKVRRFELAFASGAKMFTNAGELKAKDVTGIVEVLTNGKARLLSKPYIEVIPSNYNPALNVGSQKDQFVKKESLIIVVGDEPTQLPKSSKKLLKMFGAQEEKVSAYVKENDLSIKRKEDVIKIVAYYNQLVSV